MHTSLTKAEGVYRAAELCLEAGLYDSCVSRAYYAMFWAAIAALDDAGYKAEKEWTHSGLFNTFSKYLVQTRKTYESFYGRRLAESYELRIKADYKLAPVRINDARRVLGWAQEFIQKVGERIQ
jgi:uncharacterized protein (UPF0332 family)